jgi:hypothetical protein
VAIITEHDCKQERECYDSEHSRICFLVHRHTVRVGNFLEDPRDLALLEVGRRWNDVVVVVLAFELFELNAAELGYTL